jgi:hypothetical protein
MSPAGYRLNAILLYFKGYHQRLGLIHDRQATFGWESTKAEPEPFLSAAKKEFL